MIIYDTSTLKRIDLVGQRFDHLLVVERLGSDGRGQVHWKSICDCGGTSTPTTGKLRSGLAKSCGCHMQNIVDLTGMRFGNIVVSRLAESRTQTNRVDRSAFWVCKCDCGRETVINGHSLRTCGQTTCGYCTYGRYEKIDDVIIGIFQGNKFKIDVDDHDLVSKFRWWKDDNGYFMTAINGKRTPLHHLILQPIDGKQCDHISRDKSDNRRSNLRYVTASQNMWNKSKQANNTTGYIGVCYHKGQGNYMASIRQYGQRYYLGHFLTKEEAALARDLAAIKLFGEYAVLNFPKEQ